MREPRSIFFPLALIVAGAIWLLISMQVIPAANLWALTHLLPYLLMALGAGLILRSFWAPAGMIVSALVVIGAALAVAYAPQLGWARVPTWDFDSDFGGALAGSGEVEAERREVRDFQAVSVKYPAEVVIRQGESESLSIEAEDNLLPQLTTDVESGVLTIQNSESDWAQRVDPTKPVKITITVRDLQELDFSSAGRVRIEKLESEKLEVSLSGAGEITMADLQVGQLDCRVSGAGSIYADGMADEIELRITGFGSFYGDELSSLKADVRISGAGNAVIRVKNELSAEISGAGSVSYYGSPEVSQRITGVGSVRQLGKE